MITLAIYFPGGRYHATPWGAHVNEGLVEWPPNPWRLLRTLVATGFAKRHWDKVPPDAESVVLQLAGVFPEYHLPQGHLTHTRHYMPSGSLHAKHKNVETADKVLDTFIRLRPDKPLLVRWPVNLTADETQVLAGLVQSVTYLGRAESWVDMSIVDVPVPEAEWTRPSGPTSPIGSDQVTLLAATNPAAYSSWRASALTASLETEQAKRGKVLTKNQRAHVEAKFPADLVGCLTMDTRVQQKYGWSQPPGSIRVLYDRVSTRERLSQRRSSPRQTPTMQCALLALSSDTVRGRRLPHISRALRQCELVHHALTSIVNKRLNIRDCSVLTGRDEAGRKLRSSHAHAHYFPLDLDDDSRIDHVLIYASVGLDEVAQHAISLMRRTWTKGDDTDIFVNCVGFGDLTLFRKQIRHRDGRPLAIIPPQPTATWVSTTPYVAARHLKNKNNRYTILDDVGRELELRGLPKPRGIELFDRTAMIQNGFHKYVRTRNARKPQPPQRTTYGIRLRLDSPHPGPIAIGYGAHFGLGVLGAG